MRSRWETGQYSCTALRCDGGTEKVSSAGCWTSRFKRVGVPDRQIRRAEPRRDDEGTGCPKRVIPCFQEKPLSFSLRATVPQTDTGGQVENTQALERTQEKELGKLIP
jgi:hypothetical protein